MASLDSPRIKQGQIVAVAWQAAKGTAASTSDAIRVICESVEINPGRTGEHPDGTTGFQTAVDSEFEAYRNPKAKLTIRAGTFQAAPFLESLLAGQTSLSGSQITEANDTGNALSSWVLAGVRPGVNTSDAGIIYVTLTDESPGAGQATINLYSDAAKTALVATGSGNDSTTVTLSESNDSGLSGTVALAAPSASDTGITLTVAEITFSVGTAWSRYLTVWRDTGQDAERLTDCMVTKAKLRGQDRGPLLIDLEIQAMDWTDLSTTFSATTPEGGLAFLAYNTGTQFRSDLDGTPVTDYPHAFELEIERPHTVIFGGESRPQQVVCEGLNISGSMTYRPAAGSEAILDRALADSFDSIDVTFSRSGQELKVVLDKVKFLEPKRAAFSGGALSDEVLPFVAVQDSSAPSTAPITLTAKLPS